MLLVFVVCLLVFQYVLWFKCDGVFVRCLVLLFVFVLYVYFVRVVAFCLFFAFVFACFNCDAVFACCLCSLFVLFQRLLSFVS